MNTSSNPLIRPETPFQRRVVDAIDRAKPARGVGSFTKPLPCGVSQNLNNKKRVLGLRPFAVTRKSGDIFRVQAGTCEGQLIQSQEINVGAVRPVAILAYPKYTLGIDSGQYVNTIAVKTGLDAPTLTHSTTQFSDVDSGITSAGDEARALIAFILDDNSVDQITTGNISGYWGDDGTLTGVAAGAFDKNF